MNFFRKLVSMFCSSDKIQQYDVNKLGITMTDSEKESELKFNEGVFEILESTIRSSGYFKNDKIDTLLKLLKENSRQFSRINTKKAFKGDSMLSIEDKKALGLNPRMKYTREFIDYFNQSCFSEIEPKSELECMHLDAFHRMSRKRDITKIRQLGFVKKVRLQPDHDCPRAKKLNKIYNIDEIPDLPLPDCEEPYCRCYFEPIIK